MRHLKAALLIVSVSCYIEVMFVLLHGWLLGTSMFITVGLVIGIMLLGLKPSQWRSRWREVRGE